MTTQLTGPSLLGPDGWLFAEAYVDWLNNNRTNKIPIIYRRNARRYWTLTSVNETVRPEVAWMQHAKETNWCKFGGVLDASFCNPAGIKTAAGGGNYDPEAHERFRDWDSGIRAHINHLTAYAFGNYISPIGVPHGRYHVVLMTNWAGTIQTIEGLNKRWAPSKTYGDDLIKHFLDPFMNWCEQLILYLQGQE